jgi:lipoic acid synthetase
MGFQFVASGPLVRSSYKAAEVFVRGILKPGDPEGATALLKERLAESEARTTSELAARSAAALLIPAGSLVRR